MNSKVFIINTPNGKFVAKIKSGKVTKQDCIEQALLNKLPGENLPKVLYMQNYNNDKYCKVIKFVKGRHIYGRLKEDEYKALIDSEKLLRSEITKFKGIKSYALSHNDLNRDNILFEDDENGEIKANIIDFESLEFAPQDFQFASMLASGLLLEGEDINKIKQTIMQER